MSELGVNKVVLLGRSGGDAELRFPVVKPPPKILQTLSGVIAALGAASWSSVTEQQHNTTHRTRPSDRAALIHLEEMAELSAVCPSRPARAPWRPPQDQ
jgi:hypothetical protein